MSEHSEAEELERAQARARLAIEMRRGMHLLMSQDPDPTQADAIRMSLEDLFDDLESAPGRSRSLRPWAGPVMSAVPADGEAFPDSAERPISGSGHPFSVPITTIRDGDGVRCTITLGRAFEGAPGRSHGGIVSAVFDDLFGSLPMLLGKIAFTASLTVNYRAPSPILEPVVYRGWIERVEGKKIYIAGDARHDDVVVSTATALFIDATEKVAALYGA